MILNLLHRPPDRDEHMPMFELQQRFAHELGLKVTVLLDLVDLRAPAKVALVKGYARDYGDEIGIWFGPQSLQYADALSQTEPFIWLYPADEKRRIIGEFLTAFRAAFDADPVSVGAYHLDAGTIRILHELCPSVQIAVAGCFEEGVRVFHGCNNSWYLFNEGMPWGPWYPSRGHSLRPAQAADDWAGIVAVPHLTRDLVLSYEGRNDFFATHPANVQRGMANQGENQAYTFNLIDQHRLQERYNDGFSYCHVFVSAGWLSGNPNIQDTDEVTQGLYREMLAYFVALRERGELVDLTMREFAGWYKRTIPIGAPQVALAKEVLYGSGKHYFWYLDPYCRVLVDATQGGAIGDLRPYAGQVAGETGPDQPATMYGSYPYVIQSQHRSGNAHHFADGSRTTLQVMHAGETLDLARVRTTVADIVRNEAGTRVRLTPAELCFASGLSACIETVYHFRGGGMIEITRRLTSLSDPQVRLCVREYVKGCVGVTEYPQDLSNITLRVEGADPQALTYAYRSRAASTPGATAVIADIPQANTRLSLSSTDGPYQRGHIVEGFLFNPYFTLALDHELALGEELTTCLSLSQLA